MHAASPCVRLVDHVHGRDVAIVSFKIDVARAFAGPNPRSNRHILMAAIREPDVQVNEVNGAFGDTEPNPIKPARSIQHKRVVIDCIAHVA